jgi:hypothetical protein
MKKILPALFLSLALIFSACGKKDESGASNQPLPGVDGPHVTLLEDTVLISMVLQNVSLDGGARITIPKYPNSYLEVSPDLQSGGTLFAMNVAMKDVLNRDLNEFDPMTLPGGRPLPGVMGGSLPAVAFKLPVGGFLGNVSVYLGPKFFGVFVPTKMDIGNNIVTYRYYVGKKRAGNVSVVGPDTAGENSGLLLLLDMDAQTKKAMRYLVNKYN